MGFLVFSASLHMFFLALPRFCGVALRAISDAESVEAVGFGDFRLANFRFRLKLRAENCTNVQLFHFVWLYVSVVVVGLYVTPLTNRGVRCTIKAPWSFSDPGAFYIPRFLAYILNCDIVNLSIPNTSHIFFSFQFSISGRII